MTIMNIYIEFYLIMTHWPILAIFVCVLALNVILSDGIIISIMGIYL